MKLFGITLLCFWACMSPLETYSASRDTAQNCLAKFYTNFLKDKEKDKAKNNLEACLASTGIGGTFFGNHENSFRAIDATRELGKTNQDLQKILDGFEDNVQWRKRVQTAGWYTMWIGLNVVAWYYVNEAWKEEIATIKNEMPENLNNAKENLLEEIKKEVKQKIEEGLETLKERVLTKLREEINPKLQENADKLNKFVINETAKQGENVVKILEKKLLGDSVTLITVQNK
jgi:DNA-binding transcriptional MerR regulator